jgi:hypothetical protein
MARISSQPRVELLWWQGCASWGRALDELRGAMTEQGLDPAGIELHEVPTDREAERTEFVGSPTIRIDGRDVQSPGPDAPVGLTCRIYRLRDGRVSPTPDPDDVRDALRAAMQEVSRA